MSDFRVNELYVIVFAKKGTMVGRRAYKTQREAESYLRSFNRPGATSKDGQAKYRLERYLPAPLKEVQ